MLRRLSFSMAPESVDFSNVKAKILGHYAEVDEWEPSDEIEAMETEMKAAGLEVTFHIYPRVGHWFVENDRPEYDIHSRAIGVVTDI